MKSFIILILSVALCAAAYFTRPSKASFDEYIEAHMKSVEGGNFFEQLFKQIDKEAYLKGLQFNDRYLWVSVAHDGQTQYVGAFSHWFDKSQLPKIEPAKTK